MLLLRSRLSRSCVFQSIGRKHLADLAPLPFRVGDQCRSISASIHTCVTSAQLNSCVSRPSRSSKERKINRTTRLHLQLEVALAPRMRRHRRRADFATIRTLLARSRRALPERIWRSHTSSGTVAELREEVRQRLTAGIEGGRHGLGSTVRRLTGASVLVVAAGAPATAATAAAAVDVAVGRPRCAGRALLRLQLLAAVAGG